MVSFLFILAECFFKNHSNFTLIKRHKTTSTPLKMNGWNIIPLRFGSDHFPFYSWVMAVRRWTMLIFQDVCYNEEMLSPPTNSLTKHCLYQLFVDTFTNRNQTHLGKLTYPTWGKGKSSTQICQPSGGYVNSLEGKPNQTKPLSWPTDVPISQSASNVEWWASAESSLPWKTSRWRCRPALPGTTLPKWIEKRCKDIDIVQIFILLNIIYIYVNDIMECSMCTVSIQLCR